MNVKTTFLWLVLLYLLFLCAPTNATTLSDAAAKLAPGQFVNVTGMINLQGTAAAYDPGPASPGPGYDGSQPSAWDPATSKLYMEMTEHGNASACPQNFPNFPHWCWKPLWTYDDPTNTWTTNGPYPTYTSGGGPVSGTHTFGYTAYDSTNKTIYVRGHDTNVGTWWTFFRYCATNSPASYCASQLGQWQQITGFNPPSGSQVGTQLGWMPTLNGGTLLAFDTDGNNAGCGALFGMTYVGGVGTWGTIDSGAGCKFPAGGGTTLNRIIYSPQKNVAIFGPTESNALKWWKIDTTGARTALDNAPCAFHTTNLGISQTAEDPSTGDIIFIGCTQAGQMWRLNPTAAPGAQWTQMHATLNAPGQICNVVRNLSNPEIGCGFDFVAMSISTYGVIGFWKMRLGVPGGIGPTQQAAEFWLYKPSATSSDVTPPTVSITAPTAGATVTGAAVTLTATAADNIGVAGVQFKVDGVATGSEDTSSPYSISWNSTAVSNGSHTITATARDAAGNSTTSTGVSVTVSNGGSDFATRCKGALFCNGFDTTADLGGDGWGNARGYGPSDSIHLTCAPNPNLCPTIDTTTKVSGAGALKFTIPPGSSGAAAGSYWANPAADLSIRFGAGQTYYVQFRQRVTASYFPSILVDNGKIHWVSATPDLPGCTPSTLASGNCFASCSENEFVNQNYYGVASEALPRWYFGCPGNNTYQPIEPVTPGQYKLQNARTGVGCTYDNVNAGNIFPPKGNCFPYYPDQWVTYSYKIALGSLGTGAVGGRCYDASNPGSITPNLQNCYYGSQIQARMGLDGQPLEEVLNWTGPVIAKDQTNPTELKYGKVWFSPYTGVATIPSGAAMWFDELIISTSPIADPSATPDTTNPTVAITSPIPPTTSSTTSPIAVSGTATDNVSVTSVTWTCIQCTIKGGTATSLPGTSISWLIPALNLVSGTNTLNVVAHDAAGNVSTAATLTITYTPRPTRYIDGNLVSNCTGNYSIGNRACTGSDGDAYTTANAGTATAATVAGDTLYVRSGTYNLRLSSALLTINSGTGDTTRVKIAGYPGETVTLFPSAQTGISVLGVTGKQYVWFDNFIADGTNVTASESTVTADETSSFIRFSYIEAKNNGPVGSDPAFSGAGFLIGGNAQELQHVYSHDNGLNGAACGTAAPYGLYLSAHNSTVENSRFIHNGTYGVHQYHSASSSTNGNIIRYNEIADNGAARSCGHGLLVSSGSGHQIYGNVIRDQGNGGANVSFDHSQPCISCEFYNNTVVRGTYGAYIEVNSTGLLAKNNIFMNNPTANVINLPGGSTTFAQNLCFGTGGTTGCAITASDPLFVNYAADDFRLNTGSPALNVGVPLAIVTNSIDGTPRPQGALLDLGAYESATILPVVTIVNPTANASLGVTSPIFSLGGTSTLP